MKSNELGVEKYYQDGKVAVLISPGYGAGWSTWGRQELAYDKRVVEFWFEHHNENPNKINGVKELFKSWGYGYVYFGGWCQIELAWVPVGSIIRINEYDGFEELIYLEEDDYFVV